MIVDSSDNLDPSKFCVGQRVVWVAYTWKRPATEDEKERAALRGWKCGDEIDDMDYVLYDEAEYDQRMQQTEVQSPMKK